MPMARSENTLNSEFHSASRRLISKISSRAPRGEVLFIKYRPAPSIISVFFVPRHCRFNLFILDFSLCGVGGRNTNGTNQPPYCTSIQCCFMFWSYGIIYSSMLSVDNLILHAPLQSSTSIMPFMNRLNQTESANFI
jgi:hypothetical protein